MPITTKHPEYEFQLPSWVASRDAVLGERAVKEKRDEYLPIPPALQSGVSDVLENGKPSALGKRGYEFYLGFARFPEIYAPAIEGFQGLVHAKPPKVELPDSMKYLETSAGIGQLTLTQLWRKVTSEILKVGAIVLVPDLDLTGQFIQIACYSQECMTNWKASEDGISYEWCVLLEQVKKPEAQGEDQFKHEYQDEYLLLATNANREYFSRRYVKSEIKNAPTQYVAGPDSVFTFRGATLGFVPAYRVTAYGLSNCMKPIPTKSMVDLCFGMYRISADYYRSLYVKGDPQPWISGVRSEDAPSRIGGDTIWTMQDPQARAGFLDIDGDGIPLMRQAIMDLHSQFDAEGGRILSDDKSLPESGEAIRRRQIMHHVTLRTLVLDAGEAMQRCLQDIAIMMGEDPSSVSFVPDTDFSQPNMRADELVQLNAARNDGAPISRETIHAIMRRGGLTEFAFEEEMAMIAADPVPEEPAIRMGTPAKLAEGKDQDAAKV
jgi:hypothetical protein